MIELGKSLDQFRVAIKDGYSVRVDEKTGKWAVRWGIEQLFRKIMGWEKHDDLALSRFYRRYLKTFEVVTKNLRPGFTNSASVALSDFEEIANDIHKRLSIWGTEENTIISKIKTAKDDLKQRISALENILNQSQPSSMINVSTQATESLDNLKILLKLSREELKIARQAASAMDEALSLNRSYGAIKYQQINQLDIHKPIAPEHQPEYARNRDWVQKKLLKWKNDQFPALQNGVSQSEQRIIERICDYPGLLGHIRENGAYREQLFKFVFKSCVDIFEEAVDVFVQMPTVQKRISKSFLDKRNKRIPSLGIQFDQNITHDGTTFAIKKDVTLNVKHQNKRISLVDPHAQVPVREGDSRTVGQILEIFKKKNDVRGDLEVAAGGIIYYNPDDSLPHLDQVDYYKDIPVFENLTRAQLQEKYSETDISNAYAVLTVKASRSFKDEGKPRVDGNHSWFEIAYPISHDEDSPKNDVFTTIHPGKYAEIYPQGLIGTFFYIFRTFKAVFTWLDENEFYSHREQDSYSIPLTKERFEKLMEILRLENIEAKNGNWIFQAQGDNCSPFLQRVLDKLFPEVNLPRLYEIDVLDTNCPFPLNLITGVIRKAPTPEIGNIIRIAICTLFGAWRSVEIEENGQRVVKRLYNNELWRDARVSLPAMLFRTGKSLLTSVQPVL